MGVHPDDAGAAPREEVPSRLLAFPDGERRLTNLFQLVELLEAHEDAVNPGMTGLIHWLADRRRGGAEGADDAQLRLESDENLVKIATVHKSKGLEYSIVFCPFLWDGRIAADDAEIFRTTIRRRAIGQRWTWIEPAGEAKAQARREELAEGLRLAYVALTRAKHRCYTVWDTCGTGRRRRSRICCTSRRSWARIPCRPSKPTWALSALPRSRLTSTNGQASDGTIAVRPIPAGAPRVFPAPVTARRTCRPAPSRGISSRPGGSRASRRSRGIPRRRRLVGR